MSVPPEILQWVRKQYPKPEVDLVWLSECYAYVRDELRPANMKEAIEHVQVQLLASDLRDSMVPHTGLPSDFSEIVSARIQGPILVQIMALTDIGQSAFSLKNIRQTRIERADLTGLGGDSDTEGDHEDGPMPKYPRGMLRFELCDGSCYIPAVEFRKLHQLELGTTPLGFKLVLRNVLVKKGIAFLDPDTVVIRGSKVEDLDALRDANFLRGLELRLGQDSSNIESNRPRTQPAESQLRDEPPSQSPGNTSANPLPQKRTREQVSTSLTVPSPTSSIPVAGPSRSPYFPSAPTTSSQTLIPVASTLSTRLPSMVTASNNHPQTVSQPTVLDVSDDSFEEQFQSEEMDADFLAELDNVELQAISSATKELSNTTTVGPSQSSATTAVQVIDIDDDSEKENVPSSQLQRRVRRRIERPQHRVVNVIDISD